MRRQALVFWAALLAAGVAGWAAAGELELQILSPSNGFRSGNGSLWLVVSSSISPQVRLDGRPVLNARPPQRNIHHVRLEGLRPEGSRVEVLAGRQLVRTVLYGPGGKDGRFHLSTPPACRSCHTVDLKNCGGCHRRKGPVHGFPAPDNCSPCHRADGLLIATVPTLCVGCHGEYSKGRHPKLRHPLSGVRDPLRPGRPFDCASCHDPHRSAFLSAQRPEERRAWCKRCHRK